MSSTSRWSSSGHPRLDRRRHADPVLHRQEGWEVRRQVAGQELGRAERAKRRASCGGPQLRVDPLEKRGTQVGIAHARRGLANAAPVRERQPQEVQPRRRGGGDPPGPQPAHLVRGPVTQVAPEELVAALSAQDDLQVRPGGEVRDHQLREGTRAGDRLVEVPDQAVELARQVVELDLDLVVADTVHGGHLARERPLVQVACAGECAGEGHDVAARVAGGQPQHGARVEPAGEVRAHAHVAAQAQPHRVRQKRGDLLDRDIGVLRPLVGRRPPGRLAHAASGHLEQVAGRQVPDARVQAPARVGVPARDVRVDRVGVEPPLGEPRLEQGLRLGREREAAPVVDVGERLDPQPVARTEELLGRPGRRSRTRTGRSAAGGSPAPTPRRRSREPRCRSWTRTGRRAAPARSAAPRSCRPRRCR